MLTINSLLNGACDAIEGKRFDAAKALLCLALALANKAKDTKRVACILRAIAAINRVK